MGVWVEVGSDVVDVMLPIEKKKVLMNAYPEWFSDGPKPLEKFKLQLEFCCSFYLWLKDSSEFLKSYLLVQSVIIGCNGPPIDWQTLSFESYK